MLQGKGSRTPARLAARHLAVAAGLVLAGAALTGCSLWGGAEEEPSGGGTSPGGSSAAALKVPAGFTPESEDGVSYALPEGFGDEEARVDVITSDGTVQSARSLAAGVFADFQMETGLRFLDRDYDYRVPGAPDAERADYTYAFQDDAGEGKADGRTVRGVDVAMKLPDGSGAVFRLTGVDDYLDDDLVDEIVGTVRPVD